MSQSPAVTRPYGVELLPDLFGYCLLVDGAKLYIPKERLDAVIVALSFEKERQSSGSDWLAELGQSIRAETRGRE